MAFQLNQFSLTDHAGEKMNPAGLSIDVRISKDEASYYEAGNVLKFVPSEAGDCPVVEIITAGDAGDGVLLFNAQKSKRYKNEMVEFAMLGSIVSMVAATAMNRDVSVAFDPATGYVSSTTGSRIGKTLDIASATGDIVRVLINPVTV
jgi:hypothetical protein